MTRFKLILAIILSFFIYGYPSAQEIPKEFLITSGKVGNFPLNESIYVIMDKLGSEKAFKAGYVKVGDREVPCMYIYLVDEKKHSLILELKKIYQVSSDDVVGRIQVFDERFSTEKGIKVGSLFKEIVEAHDTVNVDCANVSSGYCIVKTNDIDAQFFIKISIKVVAKLLTREGEEFVLPEDAKVEYIAIGYTP